MADELKPYCTECNADLIVHADGTTGCECGEAWRQCDKVPATWVDKHKHRLAAATLELWVEERL
jgi:hypothetical protein